MMTAVRVAPTEMGPWTVFCRALKFTSGVGGVPATALALLMNHEGPSIVGGGGICGTLPPPPLGGGGCGVGVGPPPPPGPDDWVTPGPGLVAGPPDVAGPNAPVPPQAATASSRMEAFESAGSWRGNPPWVRPFLADTPA